MLEQTLRAYAALSTRPAEDGRLVKKHDETFLHRWPFRSDDHWDVLARLERPLLVIRAGDSPVLDRGDGAVDGRRGTHRHPDRDP